MKTNKFQFASRLAFLALATVVTSSFVACGGDDEDNNFQPPVGKEEALSDDTTPIDFTFNDYASWEPHVFFDYAGSKYIGTDTLSKGNKKTIDLRQGNHRILWFKGLSDNDYMYFGADDLNFEQRYFGGIHYNPDEGTVVSFDTQAYSKKISFSEKEMTITPYLMPAQKVKFDIHVTGRVVVNVTDWPEKMVQNLQSATNGRLDDERIGTLRGLPFVKKVALKDVQYEKANNDTKQEVRVYYFPGKSDGNRVCVGVEEIEMLCPLNGMDGIELTADVKDVDGSSLITTTIPAFSVKRGYITTLTGPLFSGSTSDWTVTMEPYN